jgi:two-component system sensor histidine kinase UhpB
MRALEQKETLQRSLLRHVVQAQEEERSRISRELHDEFAQTLTAFTLNLGTLQQLTTNDKKSQRIIAHLQDLGKNMSHGMHQLVHDLRPSHLDDLGLVPALKHLADVDGPRLNLKVDFKIDGEVRRIDTLIETVIYRISQEAITNVARHAKTDQVCVCLSFQPDQIRLRIIDQGVGFNQNLTANSPHGWGLAGMKERVESVSGIFNIVSPNTGGTSIDVLIPILQKNTGS